MRKFCSAIPKKWQLWNIFTATYSPRQYGEISKGFYQFLEWRAVFVHTFLSLFRLIFMIASATWW